MNELDNEEQELLATFETGEWQSVKEPYRLLELQGYAKASIDFISRFEAWKAELVSNPNILGGEVVFPGSRLSVQRIGGCLARGETLEVFREDYPYLTDEDLDFARIYVKAYPIQSRPKLDEVYT
jgi:uncharacterized protein (DUF433 family)